MEVLTLVTSLLLCPTMHTDTLLLEEQLYLGSTVKLILSNSSTFPQDSIYSDFLHTILEQESVKLIISEHHLADVPTIFQTQNFLHNHTNLRISPADGILRFSIKTEIAFTFLSIEDSPNQSENLSEDEAIETRQVQINSNYKGFQVRGHLKFPFNLSPNNVQYIFIGSPSDVQKVLNLEQIQVLKFKLGVAVRDERIENLYVERPLPFTRDVTIRKVVLPCDVSHRFLRHQHIVIDLYPTKLYRFTDEKGRHVGGMCYKMVEALANFHNFTFDYRFEGYQLKQRENGSWVGWIGDMIDGRADMTMMPAPTRMRWAYCDMTNPVFFMQFGMLSPIPRAGLRWQAMFLTLSPDVWLGVGLVLLSAGIMFYLSFKMDQACFNTPQDSVPFYSLIAVLMIFLRKDAKLPSSGRLFSTSFLIFSLYMGMFLDSKLTEFLTLPHLDPVPETLDDLARAPDFTINFIHYSGAIGTIYLETNQDPAVKNVAGRMNYIAIRKYSERLVETVLGKKTVLIDYQPLALARVAEELTIYPGVYPVHTGKSIVGYHSVVGLRKYSKYFEEVNSDMGRLADMGHFIKWNQDALELATSHGSGKLKHMRDRGNKTEFYEKLLKVTEQLMNFPFKPFTLDHFVFCFNSWAVGLIVGFFLFAFELRGSLVRFCNNKLKSKETVSTFDGMMTPVVVSSDCFVQVKCASKSEHQNTAERSGSIQLWTLPD